MTTLRQSFPNLCVVPSGEVVQLANELKGIGGNDIALSRPLKLQEDNLEYEEVKLWLENGFTATLLPLDFSTGKAIVPGLLARLASSFLAPMTDASFKIGIACFFVTKTKEKIVDGLSKSRLSSGFKEATVARVFEAQELSQLVENLTEKASSIKSPVGAVFLSMCIFNETTSSLGALYSILVGKDGLASTDRLVREVINLHSRGLPGEHKLHTSMLNTINQLAAPLIAGNVKLVYLDPCQTNDCDGVCEALRGLGVVKTICTRLHVSEAQLQWSEDRTTFEVANRPQTSHNSSEDKEDHERSLDISGEYLDNGILETSNYQIKNGKMNNLALASLRSRLRRLVTDGWKAGNNDIVGPEKALRERQDEGRAVPDVFRSSNIRAWNTADNGNLFEAKLDPVESPQNMGEAESIEHANTLEEAVLEYTDIANSCGQPDALLQTPVAIVGPTSGDAEGPTPVLDPDIYTDSPHPDSGPPAVVATAESRAQIRSAGRFLGELTQFRPCAAFGYPPSSPGAGTEGAQGQLMVEELVKERKINGILLKELEEIATKANINKTQMIADQYQDHLSSKETKWDDEQRLSLERVLEEKLSLEVSFASLQQELAIMRARCRALQRGSPLSKAYDLCEQMIQTYQKENDGLRRECSKLSLELALAQVDALLNAKSTSSQGIYGAQDDDKSDVIVGLTSKLRGVMSQLRQAYTEIAEQRLTIEKGTKELRQAQVARRLAEESFQQTEALRGAVQDAATVAETHSLSAAEGWAAAEACAMELEEVRAALEKERSRREAAEDLVKALRIQLTAANSVFLSDDFAEEYLNDAPDFLKLLPSN